MLRRMHTIDGDGTNVIQGYPNHLSSINQRSTPPVLHSPFLSDADSAVNLLPLGKPAGGIADNTSPTHYGVGTNKCQANYPRLGVLRRHRDLEGRSNSSLQSMRIQHSFDCSNLIGNVFSGSAGNIPHPGKSSAERSSLHNVILEVPVEMCPALHMEREDYHSTEISAPHAHDYPNHNNIQVSRSSYVSNDREEDNPHQPLLQSDSVPLSQSINHSVIINPHHIMNSSTSQLGSQGPAAAPPNYNDVMSKTIKVMMLHETSKDSTNHHINNNIKDSSTKVHFQENSDDPNGGSGITVDLGENGGNGQFSFDSLKQSTSSYLKDQFLSFFQPSDNKLAMKLFGNKNALLKERKRQQQHGKWIIHPCSSFRFYWDLLMLVMLIANLIILPVAISFFNDDLSIHWVIFNCGSDTIFLVDIIVNFRTGVITNDFADEIILEPKEIAKHYIKTWFFLDFISSVPMDYIFLAMRKDDYTHFVHAGRTLRIVRLIKLLSMLRLLRLSRLVRYISQWEEFLNVAGKFLGILNLVLLMLLLGHWNACLQFLVPMLMDYPVESWVMRCKLKDEPWFQQYTWALFKAMSHMLSIGYGRFPPTTIIEAWVTIVSMMTGATCYALFVGHAAALIQSFDTSKRLYREKFKQVEEYMAYRKLPRALRQRIANYYEHRYQGKMFNENEILGELSECLREQIINYNCRALVAAVPFFTYADQQFISEVVTKLKFEVFQPGDIIIKEGTIGMKMYFIQEGIVDIITKEGEVATSLSDGSYFGEICLLTNAKRVASVRAEVYCNLYSLDRESFLEVLHNYPLMRRTMESVAAERLSKIGQNPRIVSDREDLTQDLDLVKEIVNSVSPMPSDSEEEEHSDVDKKERRKSVMKLGLQKLGLTKSKSVASVNAEGCHGKQSSSPNHLTPHMRHHNNFNDSGSDDESNHHHGRYSFRDFIRPRHHHRTHSQKHTPKKEGGTTSSAWPVSKPSVKVSLTVSSAQSRSPTEKHSSPDEEENGSGHNLSWKLSSGNEPKSSKSDKGKRSSSSNTRLTQRGSSTHASREVSHSSSGSREDFQASDDDGRLVHRKES